MLKCYVVMLHYGMDEIVLLHGCACIFRWLPADVTICKTHCPALSAVSNGYFIGLNIAVCSSGEARSGDVCKFACANGYQMMGDAQLTCTDSGDWSGSPPTCNAMYVSCCCV